MTFEEQIRAIVREELQRIARGDRMEELYTSRSLPPDIASPATFNRACRAGAVRGAEKHGRAWVCSRAAWAEHRRASVAAPVAPVKIETKAGLLAELGARRVA